MAVANTKGGDDESRIRKSTLGTPYDSKNQMETRWGEVEKESGRGGEGEKDEMVPIGSLV